MDKLKTIWDVSVETLSPLHIGNGNRLAVGYDLITENMANKSATPIRTFRVNEDGLFDEKLSRAQSRDDEKAIERLLAGRPASEMVNVKDYADADLKLFRYILGGVPRSQEVPEQIKDPYDRPYLPGSSLKGVLRTLLLWGSYVECHDAPALPRPSPKPPWSAGDLEHEFFGPDPNHDGLRVLQVEDSASLSRPDPPALATSLQILDVLVYSAHPIKEKQRPPMSIEAVPQGQAFHLRIRLDEHLMQDKIKDELGWNKPRWWLAHLTALGRERAQERVAREQAYYKQQSLCSLVTFYDELDQKLKGLGRNEFLAQIGWGAGWESKTLGYDMLSTNTKFQNLAKEVSNDHWRPGNAFPISRVVALNEAGQPYAPLGWVKIRLDGYESAKGGIP